MKILTLLRHAKSEPDSPSGDFERALNDRGRADAKRMGQEICSLGLRFDLVLASPARRAAETVEGIGEVSPQFNRRLYNASPAELIEIIQTVDDHHENLLVVGHNPGIGQTAGWLAPGELGGNYPAAGLATIELAIDHWRDASNGSGRLLRFITPKDLD